MSIALLEASQDRETLNFVIFLLVFGGLPLFAWISSARGKKREALRRASMSPTECAKEDAAKAFRTVERDFGSINPMMVCPHCQTKGKIHAKQIEKKHGISGTKAGAAVVTGGLSILVAGLSNKDKVTVAHCDECQNSWAF